MIYKILKSAAALYTTVFVYLSMAIDQLQSFSGKFGIFVLTGKCTLDAPWYPGCAKQKSGNIQMQDWKIPRRFLFLIAKEIRNIKNTKYRHYSVNATYYTN